MKHDAANVNWEEVFIQEALELEEKMTSLNFDDLTRSRIRISLEKNILSWEKYQAWFTHHFNCAALTSAIPQTELLKLRDQATLNRKVFSQYDFWSEDLIPIEVWDSHLIVLGLEQNSKMLQIPNCIFILADPFTLSFIANAIGAEDSAADFSSFLQPPPRGSSFTETGIEGLKPQAITPALSFDPNTLMAEVIDSKYSIWDYLLERHDEYTFEVKKRFSAYAVLRIVNNSTQLFKMDTELEAKITTSEIFKYDLSQDSPFKRIFESGVSESFSISQLDFPILDYKYVCITALKRGENIVGFLVGLQNKELAQQDQNLLEELAKESA